VGRFSKLETETSQFEEPPEDPKRENRVRAPQQVSPIGSNEEAPHDAPGFMVQGDEAFYSGDPKGALRWYSRAMETDARFIEAWIAQVQILILTRQIGEAKVWAGRGLSIYPEAPSLLALRAVINAKLGMIRQAMSASDGILERKPEDVTGWIARGHILILADNKNSEFCFQQALKLSPDRQYQVPFTIGMVLEGERQWARAITYYEKALERRSTLPFAWFRIAECQSMLGRQEAARKALLRAEELCSDNEMLLHRIHNTKPGSFFNVFRRFFRSA
jgi:tetratricopeptide (TPR) repeat protein